MAVLKIAEANLAVSEIARDSRLLFHTEALAENMPTSIAEKNDIANFMRYCESIVDTSWKQFRASTVDCVLIVHLELQRKWRRDRVA